MTGNDRKNAALIVAIAQGKTNREAAELAGVGEATVYRRLRDPSFCKEVQKHRSRMIERSVGQLADSASKATATLVELLDCDSLHVRLGAARAILESTVRMREHEDLVQRLEQLEEQLGQTPVRGFHR